MSYQPEYPEPDGYCQECGLDLHDDHEGDHDESHRLCWACWREENSPRADSVNVTDRRVDKLAKRVLEVELRLGRVESELRRQRVEP